MKQYVYLFFGVMTLCLSGLNPIHAQCEPDPDFPEGQIVDPLPENDENPDGGIQDTACVNTMYSTVLTFSAPDTVPTPFGDLPIDSITIAPDGITGLPAGLAASCNPGSCVFLPNVIGCIGIDGTPAAGTEGVYPLEIDVIVWSSGFQFPFTLPDDDLAPGEYNLTVRAEGSLACDPSSIAEGTSAGVRLSMAPNPATAYTDLIVNSDAARSAQVRLYGATGQLMRANAWQLIPGENRYRLQTDDLPTGLYTAVVMTSGRQGASLRLLVQR